jgi:hypothetical protein
MICRYPLPLKLVRFQVVESSLPFHQLNISLVDIPCVLKSDEEEAQAARSTQLVTLYITVNITPPNLLNTPQSMPTRDNGSAAEGATTIPERIQSVASEHHQPFETDITMPQSREEISPTTTENPHFALDRADSSMKRIVPNERSRTWEGAIGRIKWVMDTLGPIAEVREIPI